MTVQRASHPSGSFHPPMQVKISPLRKLDIAIAALILAGGKGHRFGGPKLMADLGGQPLGLRCVRPVLALNLPLNFAVCGPGAPDYAARGFSCLGLAPADAPLSRSLAIGIAAAQAAGAGAVLVALADMPLVPLAHFQHLIAQFDGAVIGTEAGGTAMPPAVFGQSLFGQLLTLEGDRGAGALLASAPRIALDPALALDVDTPEDLAEARRRLG